MAADLSVVKNSAHQNRELSPCAYHPEPQQLLVALETTRGLLVHDLLRSGYQVYAINPKAVSRYIDRHVVSKAKTDSRDASYLAHLLRTDRHRFKPLVLLPEDYRLLDRLCLDLRKLAMRGLAEPLRVLMFRTRISLMMKSSPSFIAA
jgi:transposase